MLTRVLTLFILLACFTVDAQTVLLDVDVTEDTTIYNIGPNRKHHFFVSLGFSTVVGKAEPSAQLRPGLSRGIRGAANYKFKIAQPVSFVNSLGLGYKTYHLDKDAAPFLVNPLVDRVRQQWRYVYLDYQGTMRFHFNPRRGDLLGIYLDVGGSFDANLMRSFQIRELHPDGRLEKTTIRRQGWYRILTFNGIARLGNDRFGLYCKYRFTDYFIQSANLDEVPRVIIGIEGFIPLNP